MCSRFYFQAAGERWTTHTLTLTHTHTWLVELRNFEAIKFGIWNDVLIKDSPSWEHSLTCILENVRVCVRVRVCVSVCLSVCISHDNVIPCHPL